MKSLDKEESNTKIPDEFIGEGIMPEEIEN